MRKFFISFILLILVSGGSNSALSASNDTLRVYQFELADMIGPSAWRLTQRAFDSAIALDVDLILLQMNTYGGLVDAADSIRTRLLTSPIPVYVLIRNNAASAGALIAIACDSIYMQPGSTIGAATVVDQTGQQVPDKYQSYMRKKMRATAEERGRDPDIAEAMVDPDKVIPGISDSGKVITFTTKEAIKYGFCEKEISGNAELFKHLGVQNYHIIEHRLTAIDIIIGWLINPAVSGILIMIIIGGIYFELQTPGLGFPIIAAITAALLYFAPLYLEGLASHWELLLFIGGIALLAVEIFAIPGFGVAGIAGIVLIVTGLAMSLIPNIGGFDLTGVNTDALIRAFFTVIIASVLAITGSIILGARFLKTHLFSHLVLNEVLKKEEVTKETEPSFPGMIGKIGIAATILRPSGKVEINDEIYDATSEVGYIEKGEPVKVIRYSTSQLFVVKIENKEKASS